MTSKTWPSLLISKDTPYARISPEKCVCASEKHLFPGCDEARVTFETLPYVNYAGPSFCFIFSLSDLLSSRCYRKPLNSWSFRGRGRGEGRGGYKRPLSRMNKRGNRAGARCKFVTHVCRMFVRVRLFVKSNQILSNTHSRHFYKSSIVEAGRNVAMRSFSSIVNIRLLVYNRLPELTKRFFEYKTLFFFYLLRYCSFFFIRNEVISFFFSFGTKVKLWKTEWYCVLRICSRTSTI